MEYRIAVAHGNASGSEWNTELCLPHPATGQQACFLIQGQTFQEINWFKPEYGSWFVGDMVVKDGSLTLGTPCDPLFVLLPLLTTATQQTADNSGMFCGLEHILESDTYQDLPKLAQCITPNLRLICGVRQVDADSFYRLNNAKVKGWLCCKVDRLQQGLKDSALGQAFQDMDNVQLAAYCIAMLAEYVQESWLAELRDIYAVPTSGEENQSSQAQSSQDSFPNPGLKRPRFDPKELAKKRAKEAKDEAKRIAVAKEASTMRSISSFFAKPNK